MSLHDDGFEWTGSKLLITADGPDRNAELDPQTTEALLGHLRANEEEIYRAARNAAQANLWNRAAIFAAGVPDVMSIDCNTWVLPKSFGHIGNAIILNVATLPDWAGGPVTEVHKNGYQSRFVRLDDGIYARVVEKAEQAS